MWRTFQRYLSLFILKGSLVLVLIVGAIFVILVLQGYKDDTTRITNAAFGITAILASLCFSCSRALRDEDKDRDRFTYAGERFMHASILLITASVLKYALLKFQSTQFGQAHITTTGILALPLGVSVTVLFMHALLNSHTGLKICGDLLWPRLSRYDDYDKIA
jgi:predicted membrane channel-forming protein YqfA (hemolysin III family)